MPVMPFSPFPKTLFQSAKPNTSALTFRAVDFDSFHFPDSQNWLFIKADFIMSIAPTLLFCRMPDILFCNHSANSVNTIKFHR